MPTNNSLANGLEGILSNQERSQRCECGRDFRQSKISERFLTVARHWAKNSGQRAAIDKQIPDGWVPLFCPPCERIQIGHEASVAETRAWGNAGRITEPYAAD